MALPEVWSGNVTARPGLRVGNGGRNGGTAGEDNVLPRPGTFRPCAVPSFRPPFRYGNVTRVRAYTKRPLYPKGEAAAQGKMSKLLVGLAWSG